MHESLSRGATVIGISRSIQKHNNKNFIPLQLDITQKKSVQRAFEKLKKQNLIPNIFFLNAGIAGNNAIECNGFEVQKHRDIMEVNYFAILDIIHAWCTNEKYAYIFP